MPLRVRTPSYPNAPSAPVLLQASLGAAATTQASASLNPPANTRIIVFADIYRNSNATCGPSNVTSTASGGTNPTWTKLAEAHTSNNTAPDLISGFWISNDLGASPPTGLVITVGVASGSNTGSIITAFTVKSSECSGAAVQSATAEDLSAGDPSFSFGTDPILNNLVVGHNFHGAANVIAPPTGYVELDDALPIASRRTETFYDNYDAPQGPNQSVSTNTRSIVVAVELSGFVTREAAFSMLGSSKASFKKTPAAGDPTLLMDFIADTYIGAIPTDLTVARTGTWYASDSTGALISFAANTPRETDLGLLIEEARTNYAFYSQFTSQWNAIQCTLTPNVVTSPLGTTTGATLIENTGTQGRWSGIALSKAASSITYCGSVYAKAIGSRRIIVSVEAGGGSHGVYAPFDLVNGQVGTTATIFGSGSFSLASGCPPKIEAVGNGWYRCSVCANSDSTTGFGMTLYLDNGTGTTPSGVQQSYLGDGSSGVQLFGVQLEDISVSGYYPSSYIATPSNANVTRPKDDVRLTGTAFSSWFTAGPGTGFIELNKPYNNSTNASQFLLTFNQSASVNDELATIITSTDSSQFFAYVSSALQAAVLGTVTATVGSLFRQAFAWATNDFDLHANGAEVGTPDTSGSVPTVNQLAIGQNANGANTLCGYIRVIKYWASRKTDPELNDITALPPPPGSGVFATLGVASVAFVAQAAPAGDGVLNTSGSGTATFAGNAILAGALSATGSTTAAFTGLGAGTGVLAATGTTTAAFTGLASIANPFSMSGSTTATFAGAAVNAKAFSMSGSSTAAFTSVVAVAQPFSSSGSTTAAFTSTATAASVFASLGVTSVAFVGQTTVSGNMVLNTSGSGTATFAAVTQVAQPFSSSGSTTAAFTGAATTAAALAMAGSTMTAFVGAVQIAQAFASSGSSAVNFASGGGASGTLATGGSSTVAFVSNVASMSMDFAGGIYSGALLTDLTVVRAQTVPTYALTAAGTLTSFAANTPRRTDLGLFVEEQRTNLCLQSQTFDNAAWTKNNITVTANQINAPDGTLTAEMISDNAGSAQHFAVSTNIAFTSGTVYAMSCYLKAGTGSLAQMTVGAAAFTTNTYVNFDLTAGTITSQGGTIVATKIEPMANGWYRCILVVTADASASAGFAVSRLNTAVDVKLPIYSGLGLTIYAWGAQVEVVGTGKQYYASSYTLTTSTSIGRAADIVSLAGAAFSNWYTQGIGTAFVEFITPPTNASNQFMLSFNANNINDEIINFEGSGLTSNYSVTVGGVGQGTCVGSQVGTPSLMRRHAFSWRTDDLEFHANGVQEGVQDLVATIPTVSQLNIGGRANQTFFFNGFIRAIAYWPYRKTAAEQNAITTLPGAFNTSGNSTATFASAVTAASVFGTGGVSSVAFAGTFGTGANGVLNASGSSTDTFASTATAASILATTGSTVSAFTGAGAGAGVLASTGSTTAAFASTHVNAKAFSMTGSTTASFTAVSTAQGVLATSGVSSVAFVGQSAVGANGVLNSFGSTTGSFVSAAAALSVLSTSGSTTGSFQGRGAGAGVLATTGSSTVAFSALAASAGVLSATGLTTSAFTGQGAAASVFASNGVTSVAFVGQSAVGANSVFNAFGSTTATFASTATAASVLASSGSTIAVFQGQGAAVSSLSTSGLTTATFSSVSAATMTFSMLGSGTAAFTGQGAGAAVILSSGSSTAAFGSAAAKAAALSSLGVSSVAFVGSFFFQGSSVTNPGGVGTAGFVSNAIARSALSATGSGTGTFASAAVIARAFAMTGSTTVAWVGATVRTLVGNQSMEFGQVVAAEHGIPIVAQANQSLQFGQVAVIIPAELAGPPIWLQGSIGEEDGMLYGEVDPDDIMHGDTDAELELEGEA